MAVEPFRKPRGHDAKAASPHMQSQLMGERVGHLLGQAREQRGESLADVAKALRIRQPYLEAIENGDHEALPGLTYAIGFVRTYATYLDLDVPDMVRRYKEEAGTAGAGADLHFPTPLPEGRIPTRAILVLALLLTAFAYVGWWWFSAEDRKIADLIPTLPSSISNLLEEPASPAQPAATAPETSAPTVAAPAGVDSAPVVPGGTAAQAVQDPPVQPNTGAAIGVSPAPVTVPTAQAPAAAMSMPAPVTVTPAPVTATPAPATAPAPAPAAATAPAPAAPAPAPAASSSPATPPAQGPATSAAAAPQRAAPAPAGVQENVATQEAESDTAPPDPEPITPEVPVASAPAGEAPAAPAPTTTTGRVFGAENSSSRIEVTATGDAWVEFRDATGQLIFTRVLRAGDVFHVPNQPGLRLQTGNAGALSFKVDGATLPPIGPAGSVRRNVLIEPGALQSAGSEGQPPANAN